MKVILYMAISADGYIAKKNGSTDWTSRETWDSYFNFCKRIGNLIIGKNTYQIMPPAEFTNDCLYVVMSHDNLSSLPKKTTKVIFTDKPPKEVLDMLLKKGFNTIGIGGGNKLISSFINEDLVDEIYLDVEPILLGEGIKLFSSDVNCNLQLMGSTNLKNALHLHYKVLR